MARCPKWLVVHRSSTLFRFVNEVGNFSPSGSNPTTRWHRGLRIVSIFDYKKTERKGFEPLVQLLVHSISNAAPSAARSPLHWCCHQVLKNTQNPLVRQPSPIFPKCQGGIVLSRSFQSPRFRLRFHCFQGIEHQNPSIPGAIGVIGPFRGKVWVNETVQPRPFCTLLPAKISTATRLLSAL